MNCFTHRSKQFFLPLFFFSVFILGAAKQGFAQPDGGKLFKQNCSRCHTMTDQKLTGPGLKGLFDRVPSEQWAFDWIKNNKAMIASGDAYAVKVFNDNGKQNMDVFEGVLSDDDIKAVIAYIKAPPVEKKADTTTTAVEEEAGKKDGSGEAMVLVVIALILIALIGIFGSVKASLQDAVNAKNGLPPAPKLGFIGWASQNKRLLAVAGLVIAVILLRATYVGIMSISVYTNYLPAQPIKYSHATHAGKLQINCVYCHSGAEKGRTAGVPSANVCMNCHKAISEGPKTGKAEIAKIYEAVGWNAEKGVYDKPEKPIEWVRVHNLPDFAYFNHSQHVVAGKQDCANCHGDMTKVDEAKQNAPLTMGWCIDCHRKTEVPGMTTNPYYEELHAKLKEKYKGQPITVDKMGGLDCIKCHY